LSCDRSGGALCGGHGTCDCGTCKCNPGWTGNLVIVMLQMIHVLWITVMRYVLVVEVVNVVSVNALKKAALGILENTVKNVQ